MVLTKSRRLNQTGYGPVATVLNLFFAIILTVVALRFVFRLIGANPDSTVVNGIYSASTPLVSPFFGVFNHDVNVLSGRFEFESLVALLVYGVVAAVVVRIFDSGYRHRTHSV